jgi:hypothetical protein
VPILVDESLESADLEHFDRGPADGGAADQLAAVVAEVVAPFVAAGMEEMHL